MSKGLLVSRLPCKCKRSAIPAGTLTGCVHQTWTSGGGAKALSLNNRLDAGRASLRHSLLQPHHTELAQH